MERDGPVSVGGIWGSSDGLVLLVGSRGAILRSTDHAETWTRANSPTRYDLKAVSGYGAVVLGVGRDGTIVRSANRGSTWWLVRHGGTDLRGVALSKTGVAVAAGVDGTLLVSSDKGATWSGQKIGHDLSVCSVGVDKNGTFHILATEGILASGPGLGPWTAQYTEARRPRGLSIRGTRIAIVDGRGRAYHSRDSGETWEPYAAGAANALHAVWLGRGGRLFATGPEGTLVTTKGGRWKPVPTRGTEYFTAIWGDAAGRIYAGGLHGELLRSTDGGRGWHSIVLKASPAPANSWESVRSAGRLASVWSNGAGDVYVSGRRGVVGVSRNRGANWRSASTDTENWVYDLWGAGKNRMYAVGYGVMLRSDDNGNTWTTTKKARDVRVIRVCGIDDRNRYAMSTDRVFIASKSRSGWKEVRLAVENDLQDMACSQQGAVLICGDKGLILRSLDFGVTWETMESNTDRDLQGIWMSPDGQTAFAVGTHGTIVRSNDGGTHWVDVATPARETLIAVWSAGDEVFAVGNEGIILWSIDGGQSYLLEPSGVTCTLRRVTGNPTDVWVLGQSGHESVLLRRRR